MSGTIQLPRTNLVIGGNFDTNPWQRGTSFAGLTGGSTATFTADMFAIYLAAGATSVLTISKTADAPSVSQAGFVVNNCLKVLATTGQASPAAGDFTSIGTRIEGYNYAQIAQSSFTVSFWVKATVTGIYCLALQNSIGDRSYIAEYTINTTATWEYKTVTIAASPSAGTWDYTNGVGLALYWALCVGSTYNNGTNGSWTATTSYADTNQVNALASNNNIFELALIQVRPGTQAQPWETRTFETELLLCQRYCQIISDTAGYSYSPIYGYAGSATGSTLVGTYFTPLRTTPGSPTVVNATSFGILSAAGNIACTTLAFATAGTRIFTLVAGVAAGLTTGQATILYLNATASLKIAADL